MTIIFEPGNLNTSISNGHVHNGAVVNSINSGPGYSVSGSYQQWNTVIAGQVTCVVCGRNVDTFRAHQLQPSSYPAYTNTIAWNGVVSGCGNTAVSSDAWMCHDCMHVNIPAVMPAPPVVLEPVDVKKLRRDLKKLERDLR